MILWPLGGHSKRDVDRFDAQFLGFSGYASGDGHTQGAAPMGDFLRIPGSVSRSRTLAGLEVGRSVPHSPHSELRKSVGRSVIFRAVRNGGRRLGKNAGCRWV